MISLFRFMLKKFLSVLFTLLFAGAVFGQDIEVEFKIPANNPERYFYAPFEVPEGVSSISIEYIYDKKEGANIIDLGVFDSNFDKSKSSLQGFRGWSGGRRNEIFIAENSASRGYIPGKIFAGKWRIIFGLYKISDEGINVYVKIRFNKITEKALSDYETENKTTFNIPKSARKKPQKTGKYTWFRGDLHMHTFHSDGNWTIKSILDYASNNNLDFVAITEHNTFSHHEFIDELAKNYPELLILLGEEVTTYGGHFNVWGLTSGEMIDFRVAPKKRKSLEKALEKVRSLKIPASINHPAAFCGGCNWTYGENWSGMDSVEIWNGDWDISDEIALKTWDTLLQKGSKITAIGSSDSHRPSEKEKGSAANLSIGSPTTFIGAEKLEKSSLFEAIYAHRVFIAEDPQKFLNFVSGKNVIGAGVFTKKNAAVNFSFKTEGFPNNSVLHIISQGKILRKFQLNSKNYKEKFSQSFKKNTYIRIEIRSSENKMLALTNPIFIEVK